ncbi:MAG: bifunctional enoyl-CoA hydratase/phosphate acetyltransferase [Candidatus Wallbacteria bacterium]|nr:bifunctional enoyl-CoA hydratase/phosphate acetyltransferase [Candidatus Wallbacteria bacterium]
MTKMQQVVDAAKKGTKKKIAAACAHDEDVLLSLNRAVGEGIVTPILVGHKTEIEALIKKLGLNNLNAEIIDCETEAEAAEICVKKVSQGEAHLLMKGLMATSTMLKAVLNKEWGLRKGDLLSHIVLMEPENQERLIVITDAGMNIKPDLSQKKMIIENAVELAHKLGIQTPKVAPLCAIETVNPDMQATIDAAILSKMAQRGQIKGCLVDGPLAMDNAVSVEAAKHKKIVSEVAGHADILLVPDIESGNILYKAMGFLTSAHLAAIITGAKVPIVLTSRADSDETKFHSIALAVAVS